MTTHIKIYVTVASAALFVVIVYSFWSNHQLSKLEAAAESAVERADLHEKRADELESTARKYEEKIRYLESNLASIRDLAAKQDEELKRIETDTARARADVERARRVRAAAATAEEVCRKLAEVGHACR